MSTNTFTRIKNPARVAAAKKSWQQRTRFDYDTTLYFSTGAYNSQVLDLIITALSLQSAMSSYDLSISIRKRKCFGIIDVTLRTALPRGLVSASLANVKFKFPDFTAVVVTAPRQPIARIKPVTSTPSTSRASHGS